MNSIQAEKRRFFIGILAGLLVVIILALGGYYWFTRTQQPGKGTVQQDTIRLGLPLTPMHSLAILAEQQGFFAQAGLDVRVTEYPSGKRALQEGLFADSVDVAGTATGPIVFHSLERDDFSVIATVFFSDDIVRVVARRDSGIQRPEDLRGKRVATQEASAVHYFLHLFLLHYNLSENDVQRSFQKAEKLPAALANGDIDAFSLREPYVSEASALLHDNAVVFAAPGIYRFTANLVVLNSLIEQNPAVIGKMISALIQAEEFAGKHPEQSMQIVSERLGIRAAELSALWQGLDLRVSLEQSFLLSLEDEADWVMRSGFTDTTTRPNYLNFIYLDGLNSVKPEAITVIH